mgnify:FL=1
MEHAFELSLAVLLAGLLIGLAIPIKCLLNRWGLPPMVGYVLLGLAIRAAAEAWPQLLEGIAGSSIEFLAEMGIIALLFRVGLESKLQDLLSQFSRATLIGLAAILVSGVAGFAIASWVLDASLTGSLIVGAAFVATSIGVPAGVWRETGRIGTRRGQLFLDIAELDDILGVTIMALLFAVAPVLTGSGNGPIGPVLLKTTALVAGKLAGFGLLCLAFARYLERPFTRFTQRLEESPEPTLSTIAISLVIASVAGLLGFSVAVGAFFAGLVFSRDPDSLRSRTAFDVFYDLFVPFFFIGIGVSVLPTRIGPALLPALILLVTAFASKFVGTFVPALLHETPRGAALLGVSMVPRAEITMIIMQRGAHLSDDVLSETAYSAMIMVSIATCVVGPVLLRRLLMSRDESD